MPEFTLIAADCIEWTKARYGNGYGAVWDGKRMRVAHRVLWEREHGPLRAGEQLDHLCHNRACVNLDHLEPVTQRENIYRGDRATLTKEAVAQIRREWWSIRRIVEVYGIDKSSAWRARAGKTWVDV